VTVLHNECSKHIRLQCAQRSAYDDISRLGSHAMSLGKRLQALISTVVNFSLILNYLDPEDKDTTSGTIFQTIRRNILQAFNLSNTTQCLKCRKNIFDILFNVP